MSARSSFRDYYWIAAGTLVLLTLFFTVLYFRVDSDPHAQVAFKARRLELVNAMRLALAAASEAENSAVMSTAVQDLQTFAEQARAATVALEVERNELVELLSVRADQHELELMDHVAQTIREFQRIDKELMEVAVQNSNHDAYKLAFGPATRILQEMDDALCRIITDHAASGSENNMAIQQLANDARIGVLRIQILLLPHIAEESDQRMDEFEAQLTREHLKVRENLSSLSALLSPSDTSNTAIATSRYVEFQELETRIIKLSRENTDRRSVAIALNDKRKAMLKCQDALAALQKVIQAEPIITKIPSGR